ncbi:MAG TPA: TetR/AcrR family transcriptional regulator [Azospirillaceae bacterium]|nr:TetR/AcrR family transcriptional regulator [Azospirillaceae bacterium]
MARKKGIANSRTAILDAAMAIVSEVGAARMTLDAVAERAGVSKGGLLYNFPSKDALLQGMVQRFCCEAAQREARMREALPDTPHSALVAFLQARLTWTPMETSSAQSLLAAVATNPRMLDPVREDHGRAIARLQEMGVDPAMGRVLWLATEGLAFLELMGVSPFDEAGREEVAASLLRIAGQVPLAEPVTLGTDCSGRGCPQPAGRTDREKDAAPQVTTPGL